jgi:delta 1-pyrroline-5-carboxylate dehydrogenase
MSRPVDSKCADRSTQNESTSRVRLKELKNQTKNQTKNQIKSQRGSARVSSARASPPLIPPAAPVHRTGAVTGRRAADPLRPVGHNQWAEPAWRSRVVEARAEYKHRREEET